MPFDSTPQHSHAAEIAIVGRMQELLATPDRWCQGTNYPVTGPHCLMGALGEAAPDAFPFIPIAEALKREAGDLVVAFNDTPGRTHTEVLDLMARVRRKLEEAE